MENIKHYTDSTAFNTDIGSISLFGANRYYLLCTLLFLKNELPKTNLSLVIHSDKENSILLDKAISQENIDTSNIYINVHEDSNKLHGTIWRFEPLNAPFIHTFDVDQEIPKLCLYAIDNYKELKVDWYTVWANRHHNRVMGGHSGVSTEILKDLYPCLNLYTDKVGNKYTCDELALTDLLPILSDNAAMYCYTNKTIELPITFKHFIVKEFTDFKGYYNTNKFKLLNNYSNGIYTIDGVEYKINEKQ